MRTLGKGGEKEKAQMELDGGMDGWEDEYKVQTLAHSIQNRTKPNTAIPDIPSLPSTPPAMCAPPSNAVPCHGASDVIGLSLMDTPWHRHRGRVWSDEAGRESSRET